jgi:hypothetical protein
MSDEYMLTGKTAQRQQNVFLSNQNESMLDRLVYQDFQRRLGSDLTEKQKQRLVRTVRHYMGEISDKLPSAPLQEKNSQVLSNVVSDFLSYLNRSAAAPPVEEQDVSRMDVASRFNQLQNERNGAKATPPPPPNFRIALQEDGPSPMSQFEIARKQREEELLRGEQLLADTMRADSEFNAATKRASQQEMSVLADRERSRLTAQREAQSEMATRLVTPDPRRMFMKDVLDGAPAGQGTSLESILNSTGSGLGDSSAGRQALSSSPNWSGLADANMTLALPTTIRPKPPQQADVLIRQEDILAYKENEYNLFVYSADRDWGINKSQNRYNFTVNFDPANNGPGQSFAPSASVKFKNITRIELVKTILPIEGVDILQTVTNTSGPVYGTSLNMNILGFPYLNVYIPELDTNSFGTDTYLNQAFASIQYDANWVSDNNTASKGGYLAMIPKFLKCQKVYTPTPLATLRKLSISIQRPDGCLVSDTLDTLDIANIVSSRWLTTGGGLTVTGTDYDIAAGTYLWINTSTWFSRFMVNQGDRIQFKNLSFPSSYAGNAGARDDLIAFLQRPEGHLVVQIAYESPANTFVDGANSVGYANYIIIRSKMVDPTTGSTAVDTFGKLAGAANDTFLETLTNSDGATGRLINLSHQTTLVFRVITRDLDPTARLRPDNVGFGSTS